ncbi:MAG: hypothetical protein NUW01_04735 [Gemmatimonadaceae bacterium]|nr:hypothetical protein [Gemmatimonadaceae bacterium]
MKAAIRFVTRRIVNVTKAIACDTYGDIASLSAGPCERCVGHALRDDPVETVEVS